jgi:CAAX protease family protein
MSFFVAAMWSTSALLALDLLTRILMSLRPSGHVDLVSGVLCQAVAFLVTLFFVVFVHDRERPLSDVLALRRADVVLCILALVLGLALHGPLTLVAEAIYSRYPPSEEEIETLRDLLTAPTVRQRVALVAAAGIIGPFVEELFFRGGLLRNLRRTHGSALTLFGVSLLFAAAHLDARNFLPDFLGGLAMGYVRILSGSLWPAIFLHGAFNSASVYVAITAGPDGDLFTRGQSFVAVPVTLGLVALFGTLALRSERCSEARELDLT